MVWAGEAAPDTTLLQKLQSDLPNPLLGNCSNQTVLEPPTYASCTPPPPASGTNRFTADDWTRVVNTMLAESQAALEVVNFYSGPTNSLTSMRQSLFLEEGVELPAIGGKLRLEAGANTPVTYDLQSMYAGGLGIAASLAGVADPEVSAALWVASELASTIPAAIGDGELELPDDLRRSRGSVREGGHRDRRVDRGPEPAGPSGQAV